MTKERVYTNRGLTGIEDVESLILPTSRKLKCEMCGKPRDTLIAGLCPKCYSKIYGGGI